MKMRAFTNNGKHAVTIGIKTIMPGSTREVSAVDHPDYKPAPIKPEPKVDKIAELIKLKVDDIVPQLVDLNDEELAELDTLELAKKKPRTSLTGAIAKIQLERAQDDSEAEGSDMEKLAVELEGHNHAMLAELAELHKDDAQLLELIQAEQAKRSVDPATE